MTTTMGGRFDVGVSRGRAAQLRVLVVDGNPDTADGMAMYFELEGLEARVALTGAEAYRIASAFEPQLVLVEVWLPDADGWDVIRRLRALPQTANATLVAIADHGDAEARDRAIASGCDFHLARPFDLDQLRWIAAERVRQEH